MTLSYSPRSWDCGAVAWPRDAARQVMPSSRVRLGAHTPLSTAPPFVIAQSTADVPSLLSGMGARGTEACAEE